MMSPVGVPDILSLARLGRAQADTKKSMGDAQTEMTTGEAVDRYRATGGDISRLMALERSVSTLDSRMPLLSMARSRAEGTQSALEGIQTATDQMGVRLLRDISTGDLSSAKLTAVDAKTALGQVMGALNVQLSGRHLFAGAAVGAPLADKTGSLSPPDAVMRDIRALIVAEQAVPLDATKTFAENIKARLDAYFDPAADPVGPDPSFNKNIYRGATSLPPPVELADGEFLHYAQRADAQALRDMMRGVGLAATAVQPLGTGTELTDAQVSDLLEMAGKTILKATDDVTKMRSELGLAENRIDEAQTRTTAQRAALERARADLIGVDAYEAATRVTELETQLQAIYAMTARTTQLSLLNFLR